ncbi:MAG: CPBP family intramembrane glutamic endopeptidase [Akkermansiaceae bacterium]
MIKSLQWPDVDFRTWVSLTYTALAMVAIYYFGKSNHAMEYFPEQMAQHKEAAALSFYGMLYWILAGVGVYLMVPWLFIYLRGEKLRDYGVRLPSSYGHLWIYGAMLVIVIIMAYFASFRPSFLKIYPYYQYFQEEPLFYAMFWAGRCVRFFALEFFFRGYLLFSLKPKFGDASFFISMVPYCMLHFGKPVPETLFAIVGGIIFCWIAARTKSIWGAVVLHVSLALAMDFFAIAQKLEYI